MAAAKIRPARGPPWVRLVQVANAVIATASSHINAGVSPSQARRYPPSNTKMTAISRMAGTRNRRRSVMSAEIANSIWPVAASTVAAAASSQPSSAYADRARAWNRRSRSRAAAAGSTDAWPGRAVDIVPVDAAASVVVMGHPPTAWHAGTSAHAARRTGSGPGAILTTLTASVSTRSTVVAQQPIRTVSRCDTRICLGDGSCSGTTPRETRRPLMIW